VIVDHTNHRVLEVLESRDKDRVKAYFQGGLEDGRFAHLEEVTCDMWDAYVTAAKEVFGKDIRVTIDRFHVMKNFQDHLDQARREIQRTLPDKERAALKGTRWLWLQNDESLSPEERKQLKQLCRQYPQLGQLREQRERLRAIFEEAETGGESSAWRGQQRLIVWMNEAKSLGFSALNRFCQTLENWLELIANYFVGRSSNGPTEGFNNGLRSILRRAFGMPNFENFRARVLHVFGKPKPQESP
jgi:transposase